MSGGCTATMLHPCCGTLKAGESTHIWRCANPCCPLLPRLPFQPPRPVSPPPPRPVWPPPPRPVSPPLARPPPPAPPPPRLPVRQWVFSFSAPQRNCSLDHACGCDMGAMLNLWTCLALGELVELWLPSCMLVPWLPLPAAARPTPHGSCSALRWWCMARQLCFRLPSSLH